MNELIFIPIRQENMVAPHKIYEVIFKLGFIPFSLHLIDTDKITDSALDELRHKVVPAKWDYIKNRYLCILTIDHTFWIWHSTNNPDMAETQFKEVQHILQRGDSFIFKHLGEIHKPVRLSWRAIEFEW